MNDMNEYVISVQYFGVRASVFSPFLGNFSVFLPSIGRSQLDFVSYSIDTEGVGNFRPISLVKFQKPNSIVESHFAT